MTGETQIIFRDGFFENRKFIRGDMSDPFSLVSELTRRGFQHKDIQNYFSEFVQSKDTGDIEWRVCSQSVTTCRFVTLDDIPSELGQRSDIEARHFKILSDLAEFRSTLGSKNKEVARLKAELDNILANQDSIRLFAGYDPSQRRIFPAIIAWGGVFLEQAQAKGNLRGEKTSQLKAASALVEENETGPSDEQTASSVEQMNSERVAHYPTTTFIYRPLYASLWLLIFVLGLAIGYLLLTSCGSPFNNVCPKNDKITQKIQLDDKYVYNLEKQLVLKNKICSQTIAEGSRTTIEDLLPDVVSPDIEKATCNGKTESGGSGRPRKFTIEVPSGHDGAFSFTYEHYTIKDRAIVTFNGEVLHDTQCTGGLKTINLPKRSGGGNMEILIVPNCDSSTDSTQWDFTISC